MALVSPERTSTPIRDKGTPPVVWWSIIGACFLAFSAYLMIAWVTGPNFVRVPMGPDSPPTWMKAVQLTWTAIGIPLSLVLFWVVLVRPWRRDGRPSTDGLILTALTLLFVQDPFGSYVQHWFTYNTFLPNRGSWVGEIPGWMAFGKPGEMVPEPFLWIVPIWCYGYFAIVSAGCWFIRTVKRRRPDTSRFALVGACFLFMMLLNFVVEGLLFSPLGFYAYLGGHWSIFPDSYHKFPLHEAVLGGATWCAMSCVRHFVDDRNRTVAERGIDGLRLRPSIRTPIRFLAIYGMLSLLLLGLYNVPTAFIAANSTAWPDDAQKRSYLMDGVCGDGTGRACPGPGVPISRDNSSVPPLRVVPFTSSDSGPFHGGIFGSSSR